MQNIVLSLAQKRYSVRKYDARPVPDELLRYVLETARLAPSAVNLQPATFVVIRDASMLSRLAEAYQREWFRTIPACIVACGNHNVSWHRAADGKDHCDIDVAIAVEHICLAATEVGLGTCWVCNFDTSRCRELLELPPYVEPIVLLPIGFPAADNEPPVKKRKSLDEIVVWR